jgi:ABC-type phosphonate transport system ATPase subunit
LPFSILFGRNDDWIKDMTQDPNTTAIAVSHLKKTYGSIKAVEDVSFVVNEGEVFGATGSTTCLQNGVQ